MASPQSSRLHLSQQYSIRTRWQGRRARRSRPKRSERLYDVEEAKSVDGAYRGLNSGYRDVLETINGMK